MHLFYAADAVEGTIGLNAEESWHCAKVLRLKPGDTIMLTDGRGALFAGILIEVNPKSSIVSLTLQKEQPPEKKWNLHLAVAPTKNTERFEWFLEKATEIGICHVTPLICAHSERSALKPERLEKIMISAMKQSQNLWLPVLNPVTGFHDFLEAPAPPQRFIAYCGQEAKKPLFKEYRPLQDVIIMIGPEGDFSPDEVKAATMKGYVPVSLGESRLRTETAGVVATHIINLINENQ